MFTITVSLLRRRAFHRQMLRAELTLKGSSAQSTSVQSLLYATETSYVAVFGGSASAVFKLSCSWHHFLKRKLSCSRHRVRCNSRLPTPRVTSRGAVWLVCRLLQKAQKNVKGREDTRARFNHTIGNGSKMS